MGDATRRRLHIPPWQIPYLEKHRIFELFHELARELVIQQPDDHVMFLKQILQNAARARDTARVIIIGAPKINCFEVAAAIAQTTSQITITEKTLLDCSRQKSSSELTPETKAQCVAHLIRSDNAYELGWILLDCVKGGEDAKALIQRGVLPTHVIHLIPPFQPPLTELLYCHVPADWPEYRRKIAEIREVFKSVLKEVYLHQRAFEEVAAECVRLLNVKSCKSVIKPRILIIGPRGSGRKTQARLLVEKLGLVHVDFERLICEVWISESELGEKLRACKNEVCFHSELLAQVVNKRFLEVDCLEHGWVLTGFPYSENDFKHLDCLDTPPNRVIFLECDLAVCRERLQHKRINVYTGSVTDLRDNPDIQKERILDIHPKDNIQLIDAELSHYCENYGNLRKYCGGTASFVNSDQTERWVHETIMAVISRAPPAAGPRKALVESFNSLTPSDSCLCTPIPSAVLDCYVTQL